MTYILIDPVLGPFSSREEIEAWIAELKRMEQTTEVKQAIVEAEHWLKLQEENGRDA